MSVKGGPYRKVRKPRGNATYSVGQVARLCDVSEGTVSRWFDSGMLGGWRVGMRGGNTYGDRRIPWQRLVQFLRAQGMREVLRSMCPTVVSVSCDQQIVSILQPLCKLRECDLSVCDGLLEVGKVAAERVIMAVVVDSLIGRLETMSVLYGLPDIPCIVVLPEGGEEWNGITCLCRPINPKALVEMVGAVL